MFPNISAKTAGISAVISSLIVFFSIIILFLYTENFQLFGSWLSELGTSSYGQIFNFFLVVSAVFLLPFGIYMYRTLGRKGYMRALFLLTAGFLVLTGVFNGSFSFHRPIAYAFFAFASLSLLSIGWNLKNKFGAVTIILVVWCILGAPFINPFIETIQALVAIAWLFSAGVFVFRHGVKK